MSETEIGNIDYTTIDVDKHVTYDSLAGRIIIITGGGQGIGRGYAHYFAAQGAIPVIAEYNGENGERVAHEVQEKQGQALAIQTDVADIRSATSMAEKTLSAFGRIGVLINNAAGFSQITMAPFWELPVEEWDRAVQVNVNGAFYCSRAVVPAMQEARWGRIVNVTPVVGVTGNPGQVNYAASKAALIGMSKSLAQEVASRNITVNCVAPGFIDTPMTEGLSDEQKQDLTARIPAGRLGEPADVAGACVFLASDEASYVTGQTLHVNGGMAMI